MAGLPELKRFCRAAGGIDVDKDDVRRFRQFVDERVDDLAVAGRDAARWNGRDVSAPQDLPVTAGLQEQIRGLGKLEEAEELRQWLRGTMRRPPGDVTFGEDTEDMLVEVFGGISVALARSFRLFDGQVKSRRPRTGTAPSTCSGCCSGRGPLRRRLRRARLHRPPAARPPAARRDYPPPEPGRRSGGSGTEADPTETPGPALTGRAAALRHVRWRPTSADGTMGLSTDRRRRRQEPGMPRRPPPGAHGAARS